MKKNIIYNEIGNLQLFKPDYINENRKTLLTSDIIKEYLRERSGKKFFQVNFVKNNFSIKKKENLDIVNKKIELNVIEKSYREMKYQYYKRLLNNKNFDNEEVKFIEYKNYICPNSENESRNRKIFKNMHNPEISQNSAFQKNIRFRKNYSENNIDFSKTNSKLKSQLINSMIGNMSINKDIKLKSIKNKFLFRFKNNISKNYNPLEKSNLKGDKTEINYYNINDELKEEKRFLSNIVHKNKSYINLDEVNPFSPINNEKKLKEEYNFFRLNENDNMNNAMNKLKKFKNYLTHRRIKRPNGKFHINYVHYLIDNIRRKEEAEKLFKNKKYNNKLFNRTVYKNKSFIHKRNESNFDLNKFKSFYNEIIKAE